MLNEDALLLVLVLGACMLVVLGTLELMWPTRPRHPRRRPAVVRDLARRPPPPRVAPARRVAPPPRIEPVTRPAPPVAQPEPVASPEVETRVEAPSPPPAPTVAPESPEPVVVAPAPEGTVAEAGFALLNAHRFDEVVALTQGTLNAMKAAGASAPPGGAAQDTARLWGLMGLARQGLNDFEGARFALEEAVATAPGLERAGWEGHLVSLTLGVGRRALAATRTASPADRVASLTSAIEWLERGLAISPIDTELRDTVTAAREALWVGHEAVVNDLLQRRETAEARRLLEDVIANPECPPERRLAFLRLLDGVNAGGPA